MKIRTAILAFTLAGLTSLTTLAELSLSDSPEPLDFILSDGHGAAAILVETNNDPAVVRAAGDLADDVQRVTGLKPVVESEAAAGKFLVIAGTLGQSPVIEQLAASGKLDITDVRGEWESYVLQVVRNPLPGVKTALVIAGSDRRGTIYGIYTLSETIGVSPWYWWADVPVTHRSQLALVGDRLTQGPPAVKYRGIFLNDEDWGLRPWAAKTLEPETGNIGPKTYTKVFELLLRLHANYLWPAMHPGTRAFNFYPANKFLADEYGIVMGSSHCEQMLRDNVDEWNDKQFGDYNFVTNPDGVLKYWEQRVRENGRFENVYTLGMRGIHDGAMPGGGTQREKAERLHTIIADQREMLARLVNTNLTAVPQIFCPYKEVLPLYQLMPGIPDDITLVWPDDNYGYIRQFSNARERQRSGGAGVYYHVSYWGAPHDYLWLCSTPPALIAEEMTKAYDYGADKVWILNVGDLKPAELEIEFFLRLAWNPHAWNGTNTYDLLQNQLARDFGTASAPELTSILAEYYRLNFQRKPEHMGFPDKNWFTAGEAAQRLTAWNSLVARVDAVEKHLPPAMRDSFFELIGYPVRAAALANAKFLAPDKAQAAQTEIQRLTDVFNNQIAAGKWHYMMSDNPHGLLDSERKAAGRSEFKPDLTPPVTGARSDAGTEAVPANFPSDGFVEHRGLLVMEAAHASKFVPGKAAHWRKIIGLGYHGEAVGVYPTLVPVPATVPQILQESPCLEYDLWVQHPGDWTFVVRALPTFSVETGRPPRYAIALDDAPPQIVALPAATSEHDQQWQEDVLRNAALTESVHTIAKPGRHLLRIWMVDPGVVLDTIIGHGGKPPELGYTWPPETQRLKK